MTTATAPVLCKDRFVGWPESILPGRECDLVVPGVGWACPTHHAAADAIYRTPIADVPDERESKARREAQAMDPAVVAVIAEARSYLTACEGRQQVPDFIATLLHDPKYGTKWFRITENMANAILRTRAAEQSRAASAAQAAESQPRLEEVVRWLGDEAPRNDFAASLLGAYSKWGRLTDRQYEAVVRNLGRESTASVAGQKPGATQDGWYKVGEDIFKVQKAVHGSGNLYAKRLVVTGPGEATWEYAPGMVRQLTDDQRLTVEAAAEFGHLYGICCCCGRELTDEASIAAGIGPICASRL